MEGDYIVQTTLPQYQVEVDVWIPVISTCEKSSRVSDRYGNLTP